MEHAQPELLEQIKHIEDSLCRNCEAEPSLENYPNQLCGSCREAFIKYPIPNWIRLFAGGILVLMVIGMFRMPAYVAAAIHLSRAEKAIEKHAYLTAQQELWPVLASFPENVPAQANMLIASAYSWDFLQLKESYTQLEDKKIEDEALFGQLKDAMNFAEQAVFVDSTLSKRITGLKDNKKALQGLFTELDSANHPDVEIAGAIIANELYDEQDYLASRQILENVLTRKPDHYAALSLLAAVKRNQGDFTGALEACNQLLKINTQDIGTIAQKARIELKRKHDSEANKYAQQAFLLDSNNLMALEAKAMVFHFSGNKTESKKLLTSIQKQEKAAGDTTISSRLSPILNGKVSFR